MTDESRPMHEFAKRSVTWACCSLWHFALASPVILLCVWAGLVWPELGNALILAMDDALDEEVE